MSRPLVLFSDLSDAAQQAVRERTGTVATTTTTEARGIRLGPNSPLRADAQPLRGLRRRSAQKRSGMALEEELAQTHRVYASWGVCRIRQHHPATIGVPAVVAPGGRVIKPGTLRYLDGGAPPDFEGTARVRGHTQHVLFDVKVVTGSATYHHPEQQFHQLQELHAHQAHGGRGFLLLADRDLGFAYLVEDLRQLLEHAPLPLRRGRGASLVHLWPIVRRADDTLLPADTPLWDWLAVLRRTAPGSDTAAAARAA